MHDAYFMMTRGSGQTLLVMYIKYHDFAAAAPYFVVSFAMATIAFNDSSDPPPSYDVSVSKYSVRSKQSVFSFLQSKQKRRKASVLSLIHEIISSPGFAISSVAPIIKSCAAALPAAGFSKLLQKRNIENHTGAVLGDCKQPARSPSGIC
ncbi:hypothetical protein EV424DRAFT_460132 [Suillus variegatus]|nr:hypothetical protein EV424DRAFT_460132 [Suillus variegatus]